MLKKVYIDQAAVRIAEKCDDDDYGHYVMSRRIADLVSDGYVNSNGVIRKCPFCEAHPFRAAWPDTATEACEKCGVVTDFLVDGDWFLASILRDARKLQDIAEGTMEETMDTEKVARYSILVRVVGVTKTGELAGISRIEEDIDGQFVLYDDIKHLLPQQTVKKR